MVDAHKNFAYSTVATAPSPATTGTSLVVAAGEGTRFPAVPFNATVWPTGVQPLPSNAEIVRVTNITTDTLTIDREEEGTTARTIVVGDQIAATITNLTLTDIEGMVATHAGLSDPHTGYVLESLIDAAGDLYLGTADNTVGRLAISVPAANIVNVPGVVNGETTLSYKSLMDATAPTTQAFGDAAAAGTGVMLARITHKHAMMANPVTSHESSYAHVAAKVIRLKAWYPTTTAGCAYPSVNEIGSTTKHDIIGLAFDATTAESAFCHFKMPPDWDGGTVTFKVTAYAPTGAGAGLGYVFTLKGTSYASTEAIDAVFGTGVDVTMEPASPANNTLYITAASSALTISGAGAGEFVHLVITRKVADAADDWAADVYLVEVELTYT